tara:strand:+ start:519 stop:827 length:309 start_codon:yes stop_codon:yes gene_type:complete
MNEPIKANVAFRISKLSRKIESQANTFSEVKNKMIEKYGEKNGDGSKHITQDMKNWDKYEKEITELLNEDVDLKFKKITLASISNVKLSPLQIEAIGWLIQE